MNVIGYLCEIPDAPAALSVDAQRAAVLDFCSRLGLHASVPFEDHAGDDRPVLRRILERAHAARPEPALVVVVAEVAVLGASVRAQWTRALQLAACGAELRVADGRAPDDALMAAWNARGAADRRRERTLEGMRRRAIRGEPLGRVPYGYRIERGDAANGGRSRLVPDPDEAPVVRQIFEWYVDDGEGIRRIATRLNADGVVTRRGGAWNMASVRDLLRNPAYTGLYRRLGITIAGAHAALVTAETFRAAARRAVERRTPGATAGRRREYALSGVARCGYCGAGLVGASRIISGGGEHRYYRCGAAMAQGRCRAHTRHAEELEDAVLFELARGVERAPLLAEPDAVDVGSARTRALQRELDHMIDRRSSGQWTAEQLDRHGAALALELLALEARTAQARSRPGALTGGGAGAVRAARANLVYDWPRLDDHARRVRMGELVREIIVLEDEVRVAFAP
ncbi:MAG: recombinase family protein [Chloroflexi bacterium]|nr:recombinase family protein [Chloroflexota bacterium]MQC27612.1 recombinase family protein [Chloroflexota bacterium]